MGDFTWNDPNVNQPLVFLAFKTHAVRGVRTNTNPFYLLTMVEKLI